MAENLRNTWLCQYQRHAESRWHAEAGFGDSKMGGVFELPRLMGDSVFCLVPRGRAAWSVRFFESLWAGCVPVLLSDHYQPSFDQLFDATQMLGTVQKVKPSPFNVKKGRQHEQTAFSHNSDQPISIFRPGS